MSIGTVSQRRAAKASTELAFDPYVLDDYGTELLKKRIMIAPVVVIWQYYVLNDAHFTSWLAMREILLSEARMFQDTELKGLRYGGTYKVERQAGKTSQYKTLWGYESEAVMQTMHRLCSDSSVSPTLIQSELIEFVNGLKKFVAAAGDEKFAQEVLISAAAVRT